MHENAVKARRLPHTGHRFFATALLGLIACLLNQAHAQALLGYIQGTITEEGTGGAVEGSVITLLNSYGEEVSRSRSSRSGEFFFLALPAGEYTVRLEKAGYADSVVRSV